MKLLFINKNEAVLHGNEFQTEVELIYLTKISTKLRHSSTEVIFLALSDESSFEELLLLTKNTEKRQFHHDRNIQFFSYSVK